MKNIITLILGDWSGDGHKETDIINIKSSLYKEEIEEAYQIGTKKLGFDFCEEVASDYEDRLVDKDQWARLKSLGYKNDNLEEYAIKYNDGDISLWTNSFTDIYLFIIKLGNDKFEFKYLLEEENPAIKIGGYGLFD